MNVYSFQCSCKNCGAIVQSIIPLLSKEGELTITCNDCETTLFYLYGVYHKFTKFLVSNPDSYSYQVACLNCGYIAQDILPDIDPDQRLVFSCTECNKTLIVFYGNEHEFTKTAQRLQKGRGLNES